MVQPALNISLRGNLQSTYKYGTISSEYNLKLEIYSLSLGAVYQYGTITCNIIPSVQSAASITLGKNIL